MTIIARSRRLSAVLLLPLAFPTPGIAQSVAPSPVTETPPVIVVTGRGLVSTDRLSSAGR